MLALKKENFKILENQRKIMILTWQKVGIVKRLQGPKLGNSFLEEVASFVLNELELPFSSNDSIQRAAKG